MTKPVTHEDFWKRANKSGPDECWEWQGQRRKGNYGALKVKWSNTRCTHRIAYELTFGPIPNGLYVLHKCDNPPCCNPDHLFIGTQQDNIDDMHRKSREKYLAGEDAGTSILTEEQVIKIRAKYVPRRYTLKMLANEFNVNYKTIHDVVRGITWQAAPGPIIAEGEDLRRY